MFSIHTTVSVLFSIFAPSLLIKINLKTKRGIGPRWMAEHAWIITGARANSIKVFNFKAIFSCTLKTAISSKRKVENSQDEELAYSLKHSQNY